LLVDFHKITNFLYEISEEKIQTITERIRRSVDIFDVETTL